MCVCEFVEEKWCVLNAATMQAKAVLIIRGVVWYTYYFELSLYNLYITIRVKKNHINTPHHITFQLLVEFRRWWSLSGSKFEYKEEIVLASQEAISS